MKTKKYYINQEAAGAIKNKTLNPDQELHIWTREDSLWTVDDVPIRLIKGTVPFVYTDTWSSVKLESIILEEEFFEFKFKKGVIQ